MKQTYRRNLPNDPPPHPLPPRPRTWVRLVESACSTKGMVYPYMLQMFDRSDQKYMLHSRLARSIVDHDRAKRMNMLGVGG